MSDYAPEMEDPGDGDMLGALADVVCEHAGHEFAPAGGGLLICEVCEAEKWADEMPCPDAGGIPCCSAACLRNGCEAQR